LANDKIDKIKVPSPPEDLFFFLLDCGMARKTEPLVSSFLHEIQNNKDYTADFENHYVPVVNQTIQEHLDSRFSALKKCWLELSQLQNHFFKAMIPKNLIEYWHKGNNEGHTHLKLCGAGGGGYLLGLSTLKEKQVSLLYPNFKITALPFS
jgi:mevalonate kinase